MGERKLHPSTVWCKPICQRHARRSSTFGTRNSGSPLSLQSFAKRRLFGNGPRTSPAKRSGLKKYMKRWAELVLARAVTAKGILLRALQAFELVYSQEMQAKKAGVAIH